MDYNRKLSSLRHTYCFDDDEYYGDFNDYGELNKVAINSIVKESKNFDLLDVQANNTMDGCVYVFAEPSYLDYESKKVEFGNPSYNYKQTQVDMIVNDFTFGDVIGAAVAEEYGLPAFVGTPNEEDWKHVIELYFYDITGWNELEEYEDVAFDRQVNSIYADVHKYWQEFEALLESEVDRFENDEGFYNAPIDAVDEYISINQQ